MPDLGYTTKRLVLAAPPGGRELIAGGPVMNDDSVAATAQMLTVLGCDIVGTARQHSFASVRDAARAAAQTPDISWEVAAHVLHHYDPTRGMTHGRFITHLICALDAADVTNWRRMAVLYPDYAVAVAMVQGSDDGIDRLAALARPDNHGAATEATR